MYELLSSFHVCFFFFCHLTILSISFRVTPQTWENYRITRVCDITLRNMDKQITWSWWHHQMETFSVLLAICVGNSPVTGEFPAQRPVTRNFGIFFDMRLINGWVNTGEAGDLWRHRAHCDVTAMFHQKHQYNQNKQNKTKPTVQIIYEIYYINELVQERHNSCALAMELHFFLHQPMDILKSKQLLTKLVTSGCHLWTRLQLYAIWKVLQERHICVFLSSVC